MVETDIRRCSSPALVCALLVAATACSPSVEREASTPPKARPVAAQTQHEFQPPADAPKLCGGHVTGAPGPDGKPGRHITWDAYTSSEPPESLAQRYVQIQGTQPESVTEGCKTWRSPPDRPSRALEICAASVQGPWAGCSAIPATARSIIMISSMSGND